MLWATPTTSMVRYGCIHAHFQQEFVSRDRHDEDSFRFAYVMLSFTFIMLNILYTSLLPNVYPVNLKHSNYEHPFSFRVENNVDPDQMASSEAS